jgi:hypothetical protein
MTAAGTRPVSSITSSASSRPGAEHVGEEADRVEVARRGERDEVADREVVGAGGRGEQREVAAEAVAHQRQLVGAGGSIAPGIRPAA